jgi:hypothetical protein
MNPPTRLTLATDMSARCDRALARTALLAGAWNAELRVVHAVSAAEASRHERLSGAMPA